PCPLAIFDSALTRSFRFRIPQPPAPRGRRDRVYRTGYNPRDWANESWSFSFSGLASERGPDPGSLHQSTACSTPQPAVPRGWPFREFEAIGSLMQRRERRAQHRAGFVAAAVLHQHGRGIDAVMHHAVERNAPASGAAVELADLEKIAHHIVIDDFAPA